jgi:hypothetical protein
MLLDTGNEGNLIVRATGQDGEVVLATKAGQLIRYQERDGKIIATTLPAGPSGLPEPSASLN